MPEENEIMKEFIEKFRFRAYNGGNPELLYEDFEQFILTKLKERDEEWKTKLDYIDAQFSHINSFEHSETMPILREYRDMIEELYKKLNLIK